MAGESMRDMEAQATAIVEPRRGTTLVVVPDEIAPAVAQGAAAARDGTPTPPRAVVGGRYRIVRSLGEGGAGVVYLAVHEVTARQVALKILRPDRSPHPRFIERFYRETRWTSKLHHPGIVQILDAGTEAGCPFVVMEYLDGQTLQQRLAGGPELDEREALRIARAIAEAMAHAHANGIVHRDLKPENVMLLPDGAVKLLDFGVAAPIDDAEHVTCIGEVLGTPGYMAPEHSSGARATTAFDVYGYGMILHELLGGGGRDVWRRCESLIAQCTSGDPGARPRFVAILEQLDQLLAPKPEPVDARRVLRTIGRAVAGAVLLGAVAIVLAAAMIVIGARDLDGEVRRAPVPRPAIAGAELGARTHAREQTTRTVRPAPPPVVVPVAPVVPPSMQTPPPPPLAVATEPVAKSKRVDCPVARRRMAEHRDAYRWRAMLSALSARSCFSAAEYQRWATKANLELERFARCAELGTGSPDPEVARWAHLCRRRHAFSGG